MTGKAYEITDVIMAIENIGNELKMFRESHYVAGDYLLLVTDIAGSLELIASKLGGQ